MNKSIALILAAVSILGLSWGCFQAFETNSASEYMVVQSPFSGTLTWHTTPGTKWQGWGTVTRYPIRSDLTFKGADAVKVRFNDGGHCTVAGSLSWEMPKSEEQLSEIHTRYHGAEQLQSGLLQRLLTKTIYMTGPMMSSTQSYAERRTEFLSLVEDQFLHGIYKTTTKDERTIDPISGVGKTVKVVSLEVQPSGEKARIEESPLTILGVKIFNLTIEDMDYDDAVEAQIQQQQAAYMAVQTSIAETKTQEQKVLTTKAKGEADSAEAEWQQKVIAAKAKEEAEMKRAVAETEANMKKNVALTEASQKFETAQLAAQTAEQEKLAAILIAEGKAKAKELEFAADGALTQKLDAYVQTTTAFANAFGQFQGSLVPSVVMGSPTTSTATGASASQFSEIMNLFAVKTAKDLALDLGISTAARALPEIEKPKMNDYKFVPAVPRAINPPPTTLTAPSASTTLGNTN